MNSENSNIPNAADSIQVLWNLEDNTEYWWSAKVLEISSRRTGNGVIAKGVIQYGKGPNVDFLTDYNVLFFKGNFLFHKTETTKRPFRQNSWRPLDDINDHPTSPTISEHSQHEKGLTITDTSNQPANQQTGPTQEASFNSSSHSKFRILEKEITNLQKQLSNLENAQFHVNHLAHNHLNFDRNLVVLSLKSQIRRQLIQRLTNTRQPSSTLFSVIKNHDVQSLTISLSCSLVMYKWLVADLHQSLDQSIQFLPSLLSTFYDSRSVPSYHVLLGSFKNTCDWLQIRDVFDRATLLSHTMSNSRSGNDMLRVIGSLFTGNHSQNVWYNIGADLHTFSTSGNNSNVSILLKRTSLDWDTINSSYKDSLEIITDPTLYEQQLKYTHNNQQDKRLLQLSWKREHDLCKRNFSDDVKDIEQNGCLTLDIPLLYIQNQTAHELDNILSLNIVKPIIVSDVTSVPPES